MLGGTEVEEFSSANDAPGGRGDCLPGDDCSELSCNAEAMAESFMEAIVIFEYDGCGIDVTPDPEEPDPCKDTHEPNME